MSISPQSLARTRDKRTPKFPARFDDFSDIPPEVTLRNAAEAFKAKGTKSTSKRPNAETLSPAEPSSKRPITEAGKRPAPRQRSSTPASTSPSNHESINESPPTKINTLPESVEIDLECKETAASLDLVRPPSIIIKNNKKKETKHPNNEPSLLKIFTDKSDQNNDDGASSNGASDDEVIRNEASANQSNCDEPQVTKPKSEALENENHDLVIKSGTINLAELRRRCSYDSTEKAENETDNLSVPLYGIRKSPFHPSITIRNSIGSDQVGPLKQKAKLFFEDILPGSKTPPTGSKANTDSGSISRSPKKRPKGLSLMAKPKNGPFQSNNNINNCSAVTNTQLPQYLNNVPQTMQYGRLMINEPIYLPRSVATIAPITATYQQIANQARRPPFLSKKAEACIAYQEDRKMNLMASNYTALVRITKFLGPKDLLNLRLVNKSWKSIVSSEDVWKSVRIRLSMITDWPKFVSKILCKYQTKEVIFTEFQGIEIYHYHDIVEALVKYASDLALRRIWIRTVKPSQHLHALEFLHRLQERLILTVPAKVIWNVKIEITSEGLALVPLQYDGLEGEAPPELEDYDNLQMIGKNSYLVEFDEIQRRLLNGGSGKPRQDNNRDSWRPEVCLKAI